MPFTLCHPAIVIPLYRCATKRTSLPALVIGSMAPDFVYFFSLGVSGKFTHTPLGVPIYCVPAGLIVYFMWLMLIRPAFLAWLPAALSARMASNIVVPVRSVRSLATVLISLAIGASSHIIWDSFTHANTVVVDSISLFRSVVTIGAHDFPLYKILQQLSSLLGFIVIAGYLAVWFKRTEPGPPHPAPLSARQRLLTLVCVIAAGAVGGAIGLFYRSAQSIERGLFNFVVTGMASAGLAVVILCIAWKVTFHRGALKS